MIKFTFLVPDKDVSKINQYYLNNLDISEVKCITLPSKQGKKKLSSALIRDWFITDVIPKVEPDTYIAICDGDVFKVLAHKSKVEPYLGYIIEEDNYKFLYVPSYKKIFADPDNTINKINLAITAMINHSTGSYTEPGKGIIHKALYPSTPSEIKQALEDIKQYPKLTCDIETWGLKHYDSGLASITFCYNEHEGIAFKIDKSKTEPDWVVRNLLKDFFSTYNGTLIFHNICFDMYILTYQLYMKSMHDLCGLSLGLDILLNNYDDSMIISYLALNSCTKQSYSLKDLAQSFAGNYALKEITNIDAVDTKTLLEYNLVDGLSTWYVYNKYYPIMVQDKQLDIYNTIFKPAIKNIINMQLIGLPMNQSKVEEVKAELEKLSKEALDKIMTNPIVLNYTDTLCEKWVELKNSKLKTKKVTAQDFTGSFNPNSNLQLRELIYDVLQLPVIDLTNTKEPATGKDTLAKLIKHTQDKDVINLLQAIIDFKDVDKILTAFIPAFEKAIPLNDGRSYLYGNQNLTGTVSGRLSSNSPNLAQLPSTGSKFAKLVKSCFTSAKGWLFMGIDFSSLEDRVSALLTKDTNKLAVYLDGFDGHCLRAYSYFKNKMPDIETAEPEEKCIKVTIDGKDIYIKESDTVVINGISCSGSEYIRRVLNAK